MAAVHPSYRRSKSDGSSAWYPTSHDSGLSVVDSRFSATATAAPLRGVGGKQEKQSPRARRSSLPGSGEEVSKEIEMRRRKSFPKHLVNVYDVDTDLALGSGAFSTVWRCVHRASGQVRAVKKIDTEEMGPRDIAHEIALMRLLRHNNIVRCHEVFLEAQYVNIVVDLFLGGDLIDGLHRHCKIRGPISNAQLALIARQMIAAVAHCHSRMIVHRDVKGENFLTDRPDVGDTECHVALADFGCAQALKDDDEYLSEWTGTSAFWAPEIFAGRYGFSVDVWAVGMTTFVLLHGSLPFVGEENICKSGGPDIPFPSHTPQQCRDFITTLLASDPGKRPRSRDVKRHPWLATPVPTSAENKFRGYISSAHRELVGCFACVVVCFCRSLGCCLDVVLGSPPAATQVSDEAQAIDKDVPPDEKALDEM